MVPGRGRGYKDAYLPHLWCSKTAVDAVSRRLGGTAMSGCRVSLRDYRAKSHGDDVAAVIVLMKSTDQPLNVPHLDIDRPVIGG
jgi:hypothetical protein